jgi:hypothetical protein
VASWDSALLLLLVDGCPVVLVGWGGEESCDLRLDLLLLSQEELKSVGIVLRRGVSPEFGHVARRSSKVLAAV